jgi:hypothetical protein
MAAGLHVSGGFGALAAGPCTAQSEPQRGAPGCSITNPILKLRSSRYRIFADLERQAERFPRALHRNGGAPHEVVIACRWNHCPSSELLRQVAG